MSEHITEFDKTLSILREQWLKAKPGAKLVWLGRINSALDTRLTLMKLRDAVKGEVVAE